ncbi:MAG: hypothetical protein HYV34_02555 [Candidatus Kerfeldbacteria bacterium]|nr:hypothetical protein [Candidatus Kerfeldbacteria bacterium]
MRLQYDIVCYDDATKKDRLIQGARTRKINLQSLRETGVDCQTVEPLKEDQLVFFQRTNAFGYFLRDLACFPNKVFPLGEYYFDLGYPVIRYVRDLLLATHAIALTIEVFRHKGEQKILVMRIILEHPDGFTSTWGQPHKGEEELYSLEFSLRRAWDGSVGLHRLLFDKLESLAVNFSHYGKIMYQVPEELSEQYPEKLPVPDRPDRES